MERTFAWILLSLLFIPLISGCGNTMEKIADAAEGVCNGNGISKAVVYSRNSGIHPIMMMVKGSSVGPLDSYRVINNDVISSSDVRFPSNWFPKRLKDLQLVACEEDGEKIIEKCKYAGNNVVTRYQDFIKIVIREAQSAQVIDTIMLYGGIPEKCSLTESFSIVPNQQTEKSIGNTRVSNQQVIDALSSYVTP